MKTNFDKSYWEKKYKTQSTGWDLGEISTPLKNYIDQLDNKDLNILIPGAGHAHEAEYLWKNGFKNITIVDIAKPPLTNFKKRVSSFPLKKLVELDFFKIEGEFDLIIEQTFFCALHPSLRRNYVFQTHSLLKPNGKLAGLLFNFPLTHEGPPFGGSKKEYEKLFKPYYNINILEEAHNSIKSRQNRELFFIFEKK
ncbi:MAG: SAM-dependent methyltransferase [Flavobacteriaceae bacterium]|nr:SAM-dependent methyltransferase [Flavobacteriaceae bacterium]